MAMSYFCLLEFVFGRSWETRWDTSRHCRWVVSEYYEFVPLASLVAISSRACLRRTGWEICLPFRSSHQGTQV